MLRRNVRSLLKLALLAAVAVLCTMLTLRLIGPPEQPVVNMGGAMPVAPLNEGRADPQQEIPRVNVSVNHPQSNILYISYIPPR